VNLLERKNFILVEMHGKTTIKTLSVLVFCQISSDFVIFQANFHLSVFSVSLPLISPEFSCRCNNHSISFISTYCLFFMFFSDSLRHYVFLCWPLLQCVMIFRLHIYGLIVHVKRSLRLVNYL
jgi:hypothetical protein